MTCSLVRFSIFVLAAAMALFLTSCASVGRLVASADPYYTNTYEEVFHKWSQEARIYRGLEVVLIASATFKSEEFRRAYADEYAEAYELTPEEKQSFLEDQLHAAGLGQDFLLASFVPEKRWDDFDKPKSMWKLYLLNDKNERVSPIEVRRLKGQDPVLSHFFPFITPHKSVYMVRFPFEEPGFSQPFLREDMKAMKLVITSVLGTAEMHWEFKQFLNTE
jgi:hypothetical protein